VRIGDVIEKRRLVEPIFGELKEREAMIGRTLAEYEAAQSSKSLEQQLQELTETQSAQYLSRKTAYLGPQSHQRVRAKAQNQVSII
jgi:hypothetical protein